MEEKDLKETETVKETYTKEEVQEIVRTYTRQLGSLMGKLQDLSISNTFKRLEFLFKVLEHSDKFPSDYLSEVTAEIMKIMTIPEENELESDSEK